MARTFKPVRSALLHGTRYGTHVEASPGDEFVPVPPVCVVCGLRRQDTWYELMDGGWRCVPCGAPPSGGG